ncbi:unnamed protein product, partial [marine sediment metagenome]
SITAVPGIYLPNLIGTTGIIEYPFRDGGFTSVDMGNNTYISDFV